MGLQAILKLLARIKFLISLSLTQEHRKNVDSYQNIKFSGIFHILQNCAFVAHPAGVFKKTKDELAKLELEEKQKLKQERKI